ncbi:MAG: 2-amino-4-hydroxy-6-hydroxymethyldihydropteridine diphosphokinase [Phycisphaeraceae bacterium]
MTTVYLGLGSNLGDRDAMLRAALGAIDALPGTRVTAESPVYETPPMGPQDQGAFLNMAAAIETQHDPRALVEALQAIESALGRVPANERRRWGPREIDIDVLLFGERVINEPGLTIPHAGLADRWFVLKPLADLAPGLVHPTLGRSIAELLQALATPDHAEAVER